MLTWTTAGGTQTKVVKASPLPRAFREAARPHCGGGRQKSHSNLATQGELADRSALPLISIQPLCISGSWPSDTLAARKLERNPGWAAWPCGWCPEEPIPPASPSCNASLHPATGTGAGGEGALRDGQGNLNQPRGRPGKLGWRARRPGAETYSGIGE